MGESKSFSISKQLVWKAFKKVKASKGAPGVDDVSIAHFENDLKANLYKLWNRMSSGSYFPPPVKAVEIPKSDGKGTRVLGVPTVSDRIAQTVVTMVLEPEVEPMFHPDSYGYRPGKSALDAVATCRERCFENAWVLDCDIKAFFDTVPHDLIMKAVSKHTDQRWVLLYVERWLKAPLQHKDGTLEGRDRGTPQRSAISPLLANIFMHYVFDRWMARTFTTIEFERYVDDVVVHTKSKQQADAMKVAITNRFRECGLELHPEKTKVVYCKNSNRKGTYPIQKFDFLGYGFRPRSAKNNKGQLWVSFSPAVSDEAAKRVRRHIKAWKLRIHNNKTLGDIAVMINHVVRGWTNYYGKFCPSRFYFSLRQINDDLVQWARWKYKRLRRNPRRARRWLANVARRQLDLFVHWRFGVRPIGWASGAG